MTAGEPWVGSSWMLAECRTDRTRLPDAIGGFSKVGVAGSSGPWDTFTIGQMIGGQLADRWGIQQVGDDGTLMASYDEWVLLVFWSEDMTLLGCVTLP